MQQVSATNSKIIHWSSPVKSSEFNSLTNSEPRNSLTQKQFHQVLKYQTCRYTKRSVTSRYLQVWLYQCKKQSPRRVLWKICRPVTLLIKRLWHRCFPVNFAKFLRILFLQNTSGGCFCNENHFLYGQVMERCKKCISGVQENCCWSISFSKNLIHLSSLSNI